MVLLTVLSVSTSSQAQTKGTDLYILFERNSNFIMEVGKQKYYHPELRFPMDVGREYVVQKFIFCSTCTNKGYGLEVFTFSFDPRLDSTFVDLTIRDIYSKNVVDQKWFNDSNQEIITRRLLEAKDIYLVDLGQKINGLLVAIKVDFYDMTEK